MCKLKSKRDQTTRPDLSADSIKASRGFGCFLVFFSSLLRNTIWSINYHGLEPLCAIRSWGMKKTYYFWLIRVYWIVSSQQSSDDQSALKHPYCVYKCELINITAKHSQDNQRPPLKPNTNYGFSSGEMATQYTGSMWISKGQSNTFLLESSCAPAANSKPSPDPRCCRIKMDVWGHAELIHAFIVEVHQGEDKFRSSNQSSHHQNLLNIPAMLLSVRLQNFSTLKSIDYSTVDSKVNNINIVFKKVLIYWHLKGRLK